MPGSISTRGSSLSSTSLTPVGPVCMHTNTLSVLLWLVFPPQRCLQPDLAPCRLILTLTSLSRVSTERLPAVYGNTGPNNGYETRVRITLVI
ncbi:hypothetical protein BDV28DRAFT_65781 [Aspergillus coremiiformis]|uniref:Uncharacterized protein n=1 Tax=Aspergillus coremiiformis TaxID=138285 RepID=A0A5N6ZH30_9EURO|nr:hypothetical protein BDV28DRAFT_65781 [Aspergillus coremiiformis]